MLRMNRYNLRKNHYRGFTLLELMIVLTIATILMFAGAPSAVSIINRDTQINNVNTLIAGIGAARTYAVTHKRTFVLQAMNGDWSTGFSIKPNSIDEDSLLDTKIDDSAITIKSDLPDTYLMFDRLGRATPADSQFTVCNTKSGRGVLIKVSIFGKTEIARKANETIEYVDC